MVDLNLWQLAYDSTLLEFGTHATGHPFTRQVAVGPVDLETADLAHPLSDGIVFGEDLARGRLLTFAGAHLSTLPQPTGPGWTRPMDSAGAFEAAWRARSVRRTPGKVATLANVDRGRLVYGRPRPYTPNHELVRRGWLAYECSFATVDGRFYGTAEKVVTAGVSPGSAAAFTFPVTFPITLANATVTRAWIDNAGTDETWPVITFRKGSNPQLELLDNAGGVLWTVQVPVALADDETVTVDCRPWSRSVTRNGGNASGLLRGSSLSTCIIPAGVSEARFTATDPTGTAQVDVRWRDAYGSL